MIMRIIGYWLRGERRPELPVVMADEAILLAIKIDDHHDRLEFLMAWVEGDWKHVECVKAELDSAQDRAQVREDDR